MTEEFLDAKQKAVVVIAAFTTKGDLDKLNASFNDGLDAGLTINEIKEVLIQLSAYDGLPRSINAINAFRMVVLSRQSAGIQDKAGEEPHPFPNDKTKYEIGSENQFKLMGVHPENPALTFAPVIDTFIKEHLFADIWGRDNLDFPSRELVTIATLACMSGMNAQLKVHLNIGLNGYFSMEQFHQLIPLLADKVGIAEADNFKAVLTELEASQVRP